MDGVRRLIGAQPSPSRTAKNKIVRTIVATREEADGGDDDFLSTSVESIARQHMDPNVSSREEAEYAWWAAQDESTLADSALEKKDVEIYHAAVVCDHVGDVYDEPDRASLIFMRNACGGEVDEAQKKEYDMWVASGTHTWR